MVEELLARKKVVEVRPRLNYSPMLASPFTNVGITIHQSQYQILICFKDSLFNFWYFLYSFLLVDPEVFCDRVMNLVCWHGWRSRVAKCRFFYTDKIWVQNFTLKTRNLQLICFCDKTRKFWSIQVIVGLVCYVRRPIGYLHRNWVESKCTWVKIIPLKYRISILGYMYRCLG